MAPIQQQRILLQQRSYLNSTIPCILFPIALLMNSMLRNSVMNKPPVRLLPFFILSCHLHGGEPYKRNWCEKSAGCIGSKYYHPAFKRFYQTSADRHCYCFSCSMV